MQVKSCDVIDSAMKVRGELTHRELQYLYTHTHLIQLSSRYEKSLESARKAVSGYCTKTESLLTLLSHCLRTIQEVEIVVRQYNRYVNLKGGSDNTIA